MCQIYIFLKNEQTNKKPYWDFTTTFFLFYKICEFGFFFFFFQSSSGSTDVMQSLQKKIQDITAKNKDKFDLHHVVSVTISSVESFAVVFNKFCCSECNRQINYQQKREN